MLGDLATASRVAILVPGSDTTLSSFFSRGSASPGGGAADLAAEARRLQPGARLAVIAWLGYQPPATISIAVATSGDAEGRRAGPAAVRDRHRPARGPGRAAVPQLRDRCLRGSPPLACRSPTSPCSAAPAWTRPPSPRCDTDRPGVGRARQQRLDQERAARPGAWPRLRRRPGVARVSARTSSPRAPAATATTLTRAPSPSATSPRSRWATPRR